MFLIAGIQPKTTRLDDTPQPCPLCGATQAVVQRIDHYLSVFFIPLIKVKTGAPFLVCARCQGQSHPGQPPPQPPTRPADGQRPVLAGPCPSCGRALDPVFAYCPYCGQRLRSG